ncbi:N-acetyl-anhydromuranmyl-L-alanine amidase [Motiliproteus sp. MSK22-1]|nr:N-acetyl-anhydromuranmyl-L-alanine amidase [Motiliproteus sp. MSK22-1]
MSDRLLEAGFCESPNQNPRPERQVVDLLVIHNISLPPKVFGTPYVKQFFLNQLEVDADPYFSEIESLKVSAHLFIDRKGEVTQFVSFDCRAWHAGVSSFDGRENCNDFSIGIELEGSDDIPFTEEQYQVLVATCNALMDRYPGLVPERIVGHSEVAPGRKTDPGPAFDWEYFRRILQA